MRIKETNQHDKGVLFVVICKILCNRLHFSKIPVGYMTK